MQGPNALPWGAGSPTAAALEGYPLLPYGMGDCRTFMEIPPLAHFEDGATCVNLDYESVRRFTIAALGRDPALPERNLLPDPSVGPGETLEMQLTVDREENGLGHTLINELFMVTDPPGAIDGLLVTIKNRQQDRVYMNAPVPAVNIFGNAQLNCCLPCPILLYPNQQLVFTILNRTIPAVDVRVRIAARGKRFLPYHDMALAREMERCWSMIQTTPYWLQLDGSDNEFGEERIVSGGTARGQMSVPAGGYFELVYPRVLIVSDVPGLLTADDIDVEVTDGRIGRRAMDGPVVLGSHYATETRAIAGFPGGLFRAASACVCPPPTQFYRGNTRLIHDFTNRNTAGGADGFIRLTYAGCMHYADRCPPQADLDLVRRYGHGDARMLKAAQKRGDKLFLSFLEQNPLYVEDPGEECEPAGTVEDDDEGAQAVQGPLSTTPFAEEVPQQRPRIVSVHRPSKQYYGPGSTGALPHNYYWGVDEQGRTHLVVQHPQKPGAYRFATPQELAPFRAWQEALNQRAGLAGGLAGGPRGEWEAI